MALLIGDYPSTIDSKRRLAIAAALRERINLKKDGKDFILVMGPDHHLWLYPDLYYDRLLNTMKRSPLPDRQTQRIDLMFGTARPVKCDGQGRVVLPEISVQRAKQLGVFSDQVTLVGMFDHIEIWPAEAWERH